MSGVKFNVTEGSVLLFQRSFLPKINEFPLLSGQNTPVKE
jgi:hypothetical protein